MIDALVVDIVALHRLQRAGDMSAEWIEDGFAISGKTTSLTRREFERIAYLLSDRARSDDKVLVIDVGPQGIFSSIDRNYWPEALARALRGGLAAFEPSVDIPSHWRPFHRGSRQSFQSNSYSSGNRSRLMLERRPMSTSNVFVYANDASMRELNEVAPNWDVFRRAIAGLRLVLEGSQSVEAASKPTGTRVELELENHLAMELTAGWSLAQWYESKLTTRQREFVDLPIDRSVRLKGPAGTGKTLALVIKLLRTAHRWLDSGEDRRLAFLTHSMATVEIVRSMIMELDDRGLLFDSGRTVSVRVSTLQDLANSALSYDLSDVAPLSLDGMEGRILQLELIASLTRNFVRKDWPAFRTECSQEFRHYIESPIESPQGKYFVWELMNEFACVLDADGAKNVVKKKERYLNQKRSAWMMKLGGKADRECVLYLYDAFRQQLQEMGVVGVDQMISDYLGHLESFRWDAVRRREGYDVIFVDELHLFNRQERSVFQYLTRDVDRPAIVLMAYDAKQSPRDTFMGVGPGDSEKFNVWGNTGLSNVEQISLPDVFRYTPEITRVLVHIDQLFPALDLDEDWPAYRGVSQIESGARPFVVEIRDQRALYDTVFLRAAAWVRQLGEGRKVAVLSLSADTFEIYLKAGQHKDLFLPITSRDELPNIRYAGKKFILSRPEYVAGLQFSTVILVDVNEAEVPSVEVGAGAKRRFVSELYLAASRAERWLEVFCSLERGGCTRLLSSARNDGSLQTLELSAVPKPSAKL